MVKRLGAAEISCCPAREKTLRCRDVFETVFLGYQLLENMYPAFVRTELV